MLNNFTKNAKNPLDIYHVTQDGISGPLQRLEVKRRKPPVIKSVSGRDEVIAVVYERH